MSDTRNTAVWIFALDASDARPALDWVSAFPGAALPQRLLSRFDALGAALSTTSPGTIVVGPNACAQRDELQALMRRTSPSVAWVLLDPIAAMRANAPPRGESSLREVNHWLARVAHDLRGDVGLVGPVLEAVGSSGASPAEPRGPAGGLLVLARRGVSRVLRHAELLGEVSDLLCEGGREPTRSAAPIDLAAALRAAAERAEQVVGNGVVTLRLEGPSENLTVLGPVDRWSLLLRELLVLALRHARAGVTVRLTQSVPGDRDARAIALSILADGTAVPTAAWDPYVTSVDHESTSDRAVGRWLVSMVSESLGYVLDAGTDPNGAAYFALRPG